MNKDKLAVLIDADNTSANIADALFAEIAKFGIASVKRIYGNWDSPYISAWKPSVLSHAIVPVQQFAYTAGKNATDMAMVIDAMDLLYSGNVDAFCLVSSDSDFTRLAMRIRENGLTVYGFGKQNTPESLRKACDKFVYTEILQNNQEKENNQIVQNNVINRQSGQQLKGNTKLIKLLRDAVREHCDESGWATLGPVGSYMNNVNSDFDARNYGYSKLSELIKAIDLFELKIENKSAFVRDCRNVEH